MIGSPMSSTDLWRFLPLGYLVTIAIETPILVVCLSRGHSLRRKLFAGVWLTACTYPIVVLVLPLVFAGSSRMLYLLVAETFAPLAECILFRLAYPPDSNTENTSVARDYIAIIVANLASFLCGELLYAQGWFGLIH